MQFAWHQILGSFFLVAQENTFIEFCSWDIQRSIISFPGPFANKISLTCCSSDISRPSNSDVPLSPSCCNSCPLPSPSCSSISLSCLFPHGWGKLHWGAKMLVVPDNPPPRHLSEALTPASGCAYSQATNTHAVSYPLYWRVSIPGRGSIFSTTSRSRDLMTSRWQRNKTNLRWKNRFGHGYTESVTRA